MKHLVSMGNVDELSAAIYHGPGALLIDEYDNLIFDDVLRTSIAWNRVDKRPAPGENTGGFDQTAISTARSAARRSLGFSATNPTRSTRTGKPVKAIVADTQFGIFDRSVYLQQGRRFGDLSAKDVQDLKVGCLRHWNDLFYTGSVSDDPLEFDGLAELLGAGTDIDDTTSIVVAINSAIVDMINSSDKAVMPTAIYTNARVLFMINLELLKIGDHLVYSDIRIGPNVFQIAQLATPAGMLPLIADPFNKPAAGTPTLYPTYILSENLVSWQYIEVLGAPGAEPQTYDIALTDELDQKYKTLMFGALELLGDGDHHVRLNIQDRDEVVEIAGSAA